MEINSCASIFQSGAYLTADIIQSLDDSCIKIMADNVVLDCQNNEISGSTAGSDDGLSGVLVPGQNAEVKTAASTASKRRGGNRRARRCNKRVVHDNIISGSSQAGIVLFSANSNTVQSNQVSNSFAGLYLESSSENNILQNAFSQNSVGVFSTPRQPTTSFRKTPIKKKREKR